MKITKKWHITVYVTLLIAAGVAVNLLCNRVVNHFGLPLYLDSIGTMFIAALDGPFPGMMVGFITNMIGGMSDTSTFYYGTINVLIALIAGMASERGYFDSIKKTLSLIPFYMLLSIPCSILTFILYEFEIGEVVSKPVVVWLHTKLGLPVIASQMIGDLAIEVPDKLICLIVAFLLIRVVPIHIRHDIAKFSGRLHRKTLSDEEAERRSSLRIQIALWLFLAGFLIVAVAFFISYKTYMETKVAGYPDGNYDVVLLRKETLLYCGKMLSAVLGLLLCIVSFAMLLADLVVVTPLHKMSREMRRFAYDSEEGRNKSVAKIEKLNIKTENEIEELYNSMLKMVKDIDNYIDTTREQASTISDLHINIITTLADIVESRDETTGFHVKRTAEYCALIARELMESGHYTDEITDEYIDILTIAAPLHDIGKIKIPDAILNKPGRLDDDEYTTIKTHTTLGKEMLENARTTMGETAYLQMAEDIAYSHHEWWDGGPKGYPQRLEGQKIPLSARIMAVADVFDALVSKRPYKDGFPMDKAISIIKEEAGTHFDPEVVEAMIRIEDKIRAVMEKYSE